MARSKITQAKLADILDVTPTTMSFKLSGRSSLSLRECVEIKRKAFPDKTLDYLFATDDDAPRAHLSVNKIENGYAECDVRLTAADTKGE